MFTTKAIQFPRNNFRVGHTAGLVYVERHHQLLTLTQAADARWCFYRWSPEDTAADQFIVTFLEHRMIKNDHNFYGLVMVEARTPNTLRLMTVRKTIVKYSYKYHLMAIDIRADNMMMTKAKIIMELKDVSLSYNDNPYLWKDTQNNLHFTSTKKHWQINIIDKLTAFQPEESKFIARDGDITLSKQDAELRKNGELIHKFPIFWFYDEHRPFLAVDPSRTWIFVFMVDHPNQCSNWDEFMTDFRFSSLVEYHSSREYKEYVAKCKLRQRAKRKPLNQLCVVREAFEISFVRYSEWLAHAGFEPEPVTRAITELICGPDRITYKEKPASLQHLMDAQPKTQEELRVDELDRRVSASHEEDKSRVPLQLIYSTRAAIREEIEELERQEILAKRQAKRKLQQLQTEAENQQTKFLKLET